MLSPGQIIDRYKVETVLGTGGTAIVYRVRHRQLNTLHALKVLSVTSPAIRERMVREGQVQASLRHPNIVAVTDVIDIDGAPGLLLEFIEGPSLEAALGRYKLTYQDGETLFLGILAGVKHAHHHGLVHRDLKPANVLLARTSEGFVPKVTDFGLAKILAGDSAATGSTRTGIAMGTPHYMAPEQIRDARNVDQRADLFSLGCILYELCTGDRAFPGDEALAIYNAVVTGDYVAPRQIVPDLPDRLDLAIRGSLLTDPGKRIPDCKTLLQVMRGEATWEIPSHALARTSRLPQPQPQRRDQGTPLPVAAPDEDAGKTPAPAPERDGGPRPTSGSTGVGVVVAEDPVEAQAPNVPSELGTVVQQSVDGTLGAEDSISGVHERPARSPMAALLVVAAALLAFLLVGGTLVAAAFAILFNQDVAVRPPAPTSSAIAPATSPAPAPAPAPAPETTAGTSSPMSTGTTSSGTTSSGTTSSGTTSSGTTSPATTPTTTSSPTSTDKHTRPGKPDGATTSSGTTSSGTTSSGTTSSATTSAASSATSPAAATSTEPSEVTVKILSVPPTADILVDGGSPARTPLKATLKPGTHQVQVTSGSATGKFTIDVAATGENKWCYAFDGDHLYEGSCPR